MKTTTKHAGVVAAVLTAAGIAGACPGTAFADTAPAGHLPTGGSPFGGISQHTDAGRLGGAERPIAVRAPILDRGPLTHRGPILDRGPGWHGDHGGPGSRGDHDGSGWRNDHHRPIVVRGPYRQFDEDDLFVESTPVLQVQEDSSAAWVSESQTGTICSVAGGTIVVNGTDGSTWTWSTGTTTTVRVVGVTRTLADLRVGERITVTGLINGTARHAQTVVAVSDPQTEVVTMDHPASFVTLGRTHVLRRDRDDRCEHVVIGQHRRNDDCDRDRDRGHHGNGHGNSHGDGHGHGNGRRRREAPPLTPRAEPAAGRPYPSRRRPPGPPDGGPAGALPRPLLVRGGDRAENIPENGAKEGPTSRSAGVAAPWSPHRRFVLGGRAGNMLRRPGNHASGPSEIPPAEIIRDIQNANSARIPSTGPRRSVARPDGAGTRPWR